MSIEPVFLLVLALVSFAGVCSIAGDIWDAKRGKR
jgi:hypothetical protein